MRITRRSGVNCWLGLWRHLESSSSPLPFLAALRDGWGSIRSTLFLATKRPSSRGRCRKRWLFVVTLIHFRCDPRKRASLSGCLSITSESRAAKEDVLPVILGHEPKNLGRNWKAKLECRVSFCGRCGWRLTDRFHYPVMRSYKMSPIWNPNPNVF